PAQRAKDFDAVPLDHQFASEPLESDPSVPRPAAAYPRGYLWDNAYDHGVSFRDYGEFLYLSPTGNCLRSGNSSEVTRLDAAFGTHVDPAYAPFSLQCSDHIDREPEWEREFNGYVAQGNLPPLEIVRLPNDHTAGSRP